MVFIFHSINMVYHRFEYVEPFLCPKDKPHLTMVYVSFNVLLNLVY